jgi:hypothetical protein
VTDLDKQITVTVEFTVIATQDDPSETGWPLIEWLRDTVVGPKEDGEPYYVTEVDLSHVTPC